MQLHVCFENRYSLIHLSTNITHQASWLVTFLLKYQLPTAILIFSFTFCWCMSVFFISIICGSFPVPLWLSSFFFCTTLVRSVTFLLKQCNVICNTNWNVYILYMYTTLTTKHQRFWLFEKKEGKIIQSIQNYKTITVKIKVNMFSDVMLCGLVDR